MAPMTDNDEADRLTRLVDPGGASDPATQHGADDADDDG